MKLKVEWAKTWQGYPAWVCRYGNVVSQSQVSAMRCFRTQMRKLKLLGIDTSNIESTPQIIGKEG